MEIEEQKSKKWIWIVVGVVLLILIVLALFLFLGKNTKVGAAIGKVLPFGAVSDSVRNPGDVTGTTETTGINADGSITEEPIFRQLSNKPTAGEYAYEKNGDQFVRYVDKETGFIFDTKIKDGSTIQITNTTIPRIYEAKWAMNGTAVILRYVEDSPLEGIRDTIKTSLAYLRISDASTTDAVGKLSLEFLPDNINDISISPNGKSLFYLLKTNDGVSGSIVDITTKATKEVFRNSFSEWIPELLDNGDIILTTKASSDVKGYAYRYSPRTGAFKRLVREKAGLTTYANKSGSKILYSENISQNLIFGAYDPKGFLSDEGTTYEQVIPIATFPEKCVWKEDSLHVFCAALNGSFSRNILPDEWYQGVVSFSDSFWSANITTGEIKLLANPKTLIDKEFDVISPITSPNEGYFIFINKKDGTLWSMKMPQEEQVVDAPLPELTPDELKDAEGSTKSSSTTGN